MSRNIDSADIDDYREVALDYFLKCAQCILLEDIDITIRINDDSGRLLQKWMIDYSPRGYTFRIEGGDARSYKDWWSLSAKLSDGFREFNSRNQIIVNMFQTGYGPIISIPKEKTKIFQALSIPEKDPIGKWKVFQAKYPAWYSFIKGITQQQDDGKQIILNLWINTYADPDIGGPQDPDVPTPITDQEFLLNRDEALDDPDVRSGFTRKMKNLGVKKLSKNNAKLPQPLTRDEEDRSSLDYGFTLED